MGDILGIFIIAMGIALTVNIFFKKLEISQIIGYILTGVVLVSVLSLEQATHSHALQEIAEFGIVFLMFMIGLEFSAQKIMAMKKEVLLYGGLQVGVSGLLFLLLTHTVFGVEIKSALVIGFALALSSTAIVLKFFNESKEIHTAFGGIIVGILVFQDIAVIPILLMKTILTDHSQSLGVLLLSTMVSAAFILFILFYPGARLISYLLHHAAKTQMDEVFVGMILFIVIGTAYLVHEFGFSYSLGAFIAGMIIAETRYKHQVEVDFQHFKDLLLGVFFVTVGMQVNLGYLADHFPAVMALVVGILLLKALVIYLILRLLGERSSATRTAIALCQVGEFSFAIFQLSLNSGLLQPEIHQMLVLVVIFSMILTPFMLKYLNFLTTFISQTQVLAETNRPLPKDLDSHVVVCGYGSFGQEVVNCLKNHGVQYVAVDSDLKMVDRGLRVGDEVYYGNVAQKGILDMLQVDDAVAVVVTMNDSQKMQVVCESILKMAPQAHLVVKVGNEEELSAIDGLQVHRVINEKQEVAKQLALAAISCNFNRINKSH